MKDKDAVKTFCSFMMRKLLFWLIILLIVVTAVLLMTAGDASGQEPPPTRPADVGAPTEPPPPTRPTVTPRPYPHIIDIPVNPYPAVELAQTDNVPEPVFHSFMNVIKRLFAGLPVCQQTDSPRPWYCYPDAWDYFWFR